MGIGITDWHDATDDQRLAILERPAQRDRTSVSSGVRDILRDVRALLLGAEAFANGASIERHRASSFDRGPPPIRAGAVRPTP